MCELFRTHIVQHHELKIMSTKSTMQTVFKVLVLFFFKFTLEFTVIRTFHFLEN